MKRFEIRNGKFGDYFYDNNLKADLPLDMVLAALNNSDYAKEEIAELKKIDMSRCIESGIDCEFSGYGDFSDFLIDTLYGIQENTFVFLPKHNHSVEYCRPRMNHIHACPDGFNECPLPEGFLVKYWLRDAEHVHPDTVQTVTLRWIHARNLPEDDDMSDWDDSDIIAFEVLGIAEGYEL